MKSVQWLSSERIIPDWGVATTGQLISLPDDLADKFITQGEAILPVPVSTKKLMKEVES